MLTEMIKMTRYYRNEMDIPVHINFYLIHSVIHLSLCVSMYDLPRKDM